MEVLDGPPWAGSPITKDKLGVTRNTELHDIG